MTANDLKTVFIRSEIRGYDYLATPLYLLLIILLATRNIQHHHLKMAGCYRLRSDHLGYKPHGQLLELHDSSVAEKLGSVVLVGKLAATSWNCSRRTSTWWYSLAIKPNPQGTSHNGSPIKTKELLLSSTIAAVPPLLQCQCTH